MQMTSSSSSYNSVLLTFWTLVDFEIREKNETLLRSRTCCLSIKFFYVLPALLAAFVLVLVLHLTKKLNGMRINGVEFRHVQKSSFLFNF